MAKNNFLKEPSEVESFAIDWTDRLTNDIVSADTISTSNWTISPSGLTEDNNVIDNSNTRAVIQVSGGTDGIFYTLENTITTAQGRTLIAEIVIQVRD